MHDLLRRYVWYPGLRSDCDDYVRSCTRCSQSKSSQSRPPPLLPQLSSYPNETLVIYVVTRGHAERPGTWKIICVDLC